MGLELEVVAETNKFDVIVVGGGVAGMTASAVITQTGLKSSFLEKEVPGGKLMYLDTINNFSTPGIAGKDLAVSVFNQATKDVKTKYNYGNVQFIKSKNDKFYLFTEDGQTWEAKALVIATGTNIKRLNVPGDEQLFNHGLSYCVLCDCVLAKDKKVVLIGNTNHLDNLKQFAKEVIVLKPEEVKAFKGDNKLQSVVKTDGTNIDCDMVFVEIGFESQLKFLPSEVKLSDKNEIIVDNNMQTNFPGIFACGDCIAKEKKFIEPAMQEAAIAADSAVKYINSKHW